MNWFALAWTTMASACLTLGLIYLLVWHKQRSRPANLVFFALGASVAVYGVIEMLMLRSQTPEEIWVALRALQWPLMLLVLSILAFIRVDFGAGRLWLAGAAGGLRVLATFATSWSGTTPQFEKVTALQHTTLWGATFATPIGPPDKWLAFVQFSNLLVLIFVVDAAITLWRRGDVDSRRRALVVGGALGVCIVAASTLNTLMILGALRLPSVFLPTFLVVVLAMGYELGLDVINAARLSRELHESQQQIELAAQGANIAFWSWDAAHETVWMSGRGRALFELDHPDRIDVEAFLSRVHPDERNAVRRSVEAALASGDTFDREIRLALPSGTPRWIAARGRVATGSHGALRGVAIDVTARVRAEQEAALQRSELAHLSRVATVGALAGSLAHEINQPLMGILANAEAGQSFMAQRNVDFPELRDILADIVEDDRRAGEVIRRLRVLLRKGEVQRTALDIGSVVEEVLRLMHNDLTNRGVVAEAEIPEGLPPVLADRVQMQQVLLNLIVNACDAMGESQLRELEIRARVAGPAIEVSVKDAGTGIGPDVLERIFEPFITTKAHGMGLGLSVCASIVSAHGGRISAENDAGGGAVVRFTVPIATRATA